MEDEKQGDVTIDLFAALDMEKDTVAERSPELENSQTLGLLTGFLSVDDWQADFTSLMIVDILMYEFVNVGKYFEALMCLVIVPCDDHSCSWDCDLCLNL